MVTLVSVQGHVEVCVCLWGEEERALLRKPSSEGQRAPQRELSRQQFACTSQLTQWQLRQFRGMYSRVWGGGAEGWIKGFAERT